MTFHDISAVLNAIRSDSLTERLRRARPAIVEALRAGQPYVFREGGKEYTIKLRPEA